MLAGVVISGPRRLFRNPYVWSGAAIALVLWSPWILWQADHGWPQIDVSQSIAGGGSTSSEAWWAIVPFQFLLVSPVLAPVWIAGLVGLFRDPALRDVRFLAWAWVVLAGVFMASGGKPYYLAGLLPVLLGAGAPYVDRWLERGVRARVAVLGVGPRGERGDQRHHRAANPSPPTAWGRSWTPTRTSARRSAGPSSPSRWPMSTRGCPSGGPVVILARNYGEAGAIDRYGPALGLPGAYSGHNAYGDWGPPPDSAAPVIAVGLRGGDLAHLRDCKLAARIDNRDGVDNQERGAAVMVCSGPRRPWSQEWPALRHLG